MQIAAENRLGGLGAGRGRRDENRRYQGLAFNHVQEQWLCVHLDLRWRRRTTAYAEGR
jgi:hypothetical protein